MPKPKPALEAVEDTDDLPPAPPAEPKVELVDITFRGATFKIPKEMDEWPTEACIALSQKEYVLAAKLLLGSSQWALLQALGSKRKDVMEFLPIFSDVINKDCVA